MSVGKPILLLILVKRRRDLECTLNEESVPLTGSCSMAPQDTELPPEAF